MKIIHITYSNFIGGASIAANRIHNSLLKRNIQSLMWVNEPDSEQDILQQNLKNNKFYKKIRRYLTWPLLLTLKTKIPIHHSISILPSNWIEQINRSDADIINLHWVQREMISIKDISRINKPIVWTLHDMWAFCGAEHYTPDLRWREGYTPYNRPSYEFGFDINYWTWKRKKKYWKKPLQIITPSKWLAKCVNNSALMNSWPVNVIPNPINTKLFTPIKKEFARLNLGISKESKLIIFGADGGVGDERKGFDLLIKSLIFLKKNFSTINFELIIFGQKKPKFIQKVNFNIKYFGFVKDQDKLSLIYNAADLMAIPSRQDNLPNTSLEAHSCGTPIVSFSIGGLPDLVKHKKTGFLAKAFNTKDFANGIAWVLKNNINGKLSKNARAQIVKNFSEKIISQKYIHIYKKVLHSTN